MGDERSLWFYSEKQIVSIGCGEFGGVLFLVSYFILKFSAEVLMRVTIEYGLSELFDAVEKLCLDILLAWESCFFSLTFVY